MPHKHAGADWIKRRMYRDENDPQMSPLGEAAADLLGDLFEGIYHLDPARLYAVDWTNDTWVRISIGWTPFCTVDGNLLTVLVVLAHDRMLRVEMGAATHKYLELVFYQRHSRTGEYWERYPTLEDHIAQIRAIYPPPGGSKQ